MPRRIQHDRRHRIPDGNTGPIGAEFHHGRARGLDPKVMHRMVRTYYDELRMRMNHRVRRKANG